MNHAPEKTFYLTTPIYYVNDAPHIGHAYTTVAGDVLTRWHRQRGEAVWFLTGTDEHGQKIERAALKQGILPRQLADRVVARYDILLQWVFRHQGLTLVVALMTMESSVLPVPSELVMPSEIVERVNKRWKELGL